jgi:hypothetical protein
LTADGDDEFVWYEIPLGGRRRDPHAAENIEAYKQVFRAHANKYPRFHEMFSRKPEQHAGRLRCIASDERTPMA